MSRPPNQYDTTELLSKMTGRKTVQKATYNFSGSRLSPIANHMSATVDQVERPLMTPDEVMRLRPPKKRGRGSKERIVAPGDMLVFVSGQYPIYGTQILYFTDPVLSKRAVIPSRSQFVPGLFPVPMLGIQRKRRCSQCSEVAAVLYTNREDGKKQIH